MMTEEGHEHTREGSRQVKRHIHLLIIIGLVFLGVAALLGVALLWCDLWYEPQVPLEALEARSKYILDHQKERVQRRAGLRGDRVDEHEAEGSISRLLLYSAAEDLAAKARSRIGDPIVAAMSVAAVVGVPCFVLGCIPFRARLMALGILLLGVTTAFAPEVIHHMDRYRSLDSLVGVFVITVTGLGGLVCAALGLVRLLGKRKGT